MNTERYADNIKKITYPPSQKHPTGHVMFQGQVTYTDPETGQRKQPKFADPNVIAVERWVREQLTKKDQGVRLTTGRRTVEQACAEWLDGKVFKSEANRDQSVSLLIPLRGILGNVQVKDLTRSHVERFLDRMSKPGGWTRANGRPTAAWGATTQNATLKKLSLVLDREILAGYRQTNVADQVERRHQDKLPIATFTAEEKAAFLVHRAKDRNILIYRLGLIGLRREEIAGLRWSDIKFDGGMPVALTVRNTRVSVRGQVTERELTKTIDGLRTLDLTQGASTTAAELVRQRTRQAADKLALGAAWGAGAYVVMTQAGEPPHPETISQYWDAAVKAWGGKRITLHKARHTCATLMLEGGATHKQVQQWLGHADAAFTLKTYGQDTDANMIQAAASSALA